MKKDFHINIEINEWFSTVTEFLEDGMIVYDIQNLYRFKFNKKEYEILKDSYIV